MGIYIYIYMYVYMYICIYLHIDIQKVVWGYGGVMVETLEATTIISGLGLGEWINTLNPRNSYARSLHIPI